MRNWFQFFRRRQNPHSYEIDPDEIFLDASNLPDFNTSQFEGRIEKPIATRAVLLLGIVFVLFAFGYTGRMYVLQIQQGEAYALQSERNRLEQRTLFPERGVITDRRGVELVTNVLAEGEDFAHRVYPTEAGFSHLLGYVSYPQKDTSGTYFQNEYVGKAGVEKAYGSLLSGVSGLALAEVNALGNVESKGVVRDAVAGATLKLSIDARVETELYKAIKGLAEKVGFQGGAGILMDVHTGELLALTSYPEFDSTVLSNGEPKETINSYVQDTVHKPFLNRALGGLYTPGSIVKPYVALGALTENIISPTTKILSTGSISIPNPYDKTHPTLFKDWRAQGWVDVKDALAVSSNVYFYEVGGGYQDQGGLGIDRLEKYFSMFGFGKPTGIAFGDELSGLIPTPAWKQKTFPKEAWNIGDTYHTAIGQYGFQVTPLQIVRAVSAVANGGTLLTPHVAVGEENPSEKLPIAPENFQIVREGMREGVLRGTGVGLQIPGLNVASKSGTAELDAGKLYVNSWITGFFPYENPRYAFAVVMEQGPRTNTIGGVFVMRQVLQYMQENTPEYTK